jgi:hypothetical protein
MVLADCRRLRKGRIIIMSTLCVRFGIMQENRKTNVGGSWKLRCQKLVAATLQRTATGYAYAHVRTCVCMYVCTHARKQARIYVSGQHSCFIFGKSRVQILDRRPVILIKIFRGFPQSFHTNPEIVH